MSATSRRRHFSDTGLLVLGLIAVVATAIVLPHDHTTTRRQTTSVQSDQRDGAMALRLWLEDIGYRTEIITASQADLDGFDVIFVLEPDHPYAPADAEAVSKWVAGGHTLVAAGTGPATSSLLTPYDVSLIGWYYEGSLSQTSPALSSPHFGAVEAGNSIATITTSRTDVAIHLVSESGEPVMASIFHGRGIVWVVGTAYPFTNEGLHTESNAGLILNLLAHVQDGATIGFDETLRMSAQQQPSGLTDWLVTSRAGSSILAAAGLIMVFLLLHGRRFGRPVPLTQEQLRREPVEFIVAMAHLMRRSGHRGEALRHYRLELQRVLAQRYGVDPYASADELVGVVALHDPTLDPAALARLLQQLSRRSVSEQELVRLALAVHEWIGERD
jgi:hypothetical protein